MACVTQELQFVTMKTVPAIGGDVHGRSGNGYTEDGKKARAGKGVWIVLGLIAEGPGHT
jgi:hypothetical protein